MMDIPELNAALSDRAETLALALVGDEPTSRTHDTLRFRRKGSLVVWINGERAGGFFDHESRQGGDALAFVRHMIGGDMKAAYHWARDWLGGTAQAVPVRKPASRPPFDTVALAKAIWREAVPARGTIVETYLESRGLRLPDAARMIRFHPSCPRRAERHPAMLALMTDSRAGKPVGVHRTFLSPDGTGKAEGAPQRAMAGNTGVIRLYEDDGAGLGITEGIENALAVAQAALWRPVWAATSAGAIARFPVLDGIDALTVFADADPPGMKAARECIARWTDAGREARIIAPPVGDWNDVLRKTA